jgi:hypothetical protein
VYDKSVTVMVASRESEMPLTKETWDPQEVQAFCLKHDLTDKLDIAVDLINQTFPEAQSVTVGMEDDPEADQRLVLIDVLVQGPAKEIRLRHRECARRILQILPWPQSTLIHTTYTLA